MGTEELVMFLKYLFHNPEDLSSDCVISISGGRWSDHLNFQTS